MKVFVDRLQNKRLKLSFPFSSENLARVKKIDGTKWHQDLKYWSIPDSPNSMEQPKFPDLI